MRGLATPPRLPKLRTPPKSPTGNRFVPRGAELVVSGPGDPPPGFINGQNSLTEWVCYWALAKIFDNPRTEDLRKPPFYGGFPDWGYQVAELGGHVRALGSAVVDFVIYQGGTIIGVRIQTERFHIFTDSRRHAMDSLQLAQLEANGMRVVDVYDTDLLGDPSGQKAVVAMKRAIGRLPKIDPILAGTAFRASRIKPLG
jgi:hypothetical protein